MAETPTMAEKEGQQFIQSGIEIKNKFLQEYFVSRKQHEIQLLVKTPTMAETPTTAETPPTAEKETHKIKRLQIFLL